MMKEKEYVQTVVEFFLCKFGWILSENQLIIPPRDPQVDPTLRVWTKSGDYPGVAFTRSIGDAVADSLGCFGEPEFTELTATNEDGFIVIASDGVWEFMTSQLVVELVAPFADAKEAARKLCNEAKKRWLSLEVGCVQKHEGTLQLSQ